MEATGQAEQVGLEAREEVGEAAGLCVEGAEDPEDQDPKRVKAPQRGSCGRDPTLWCSPAGDGGCTPGGWGCYVWTLGVMVPRVYPEAQLPLSIELHSASARRGGGPRNVSRWPSWGPRQSCGLLPKVCFYLHRAHPGSGPL